MEIRLPPLGEGADSGTVVNVLVKPGEAIQKEQPLLELETEKAVGTIPSPAAGKVAKVQVKVGDKISVGALILTLEGAGPAAAPPSPKPRAESAEAAAPAAAPVPASPKPTPPASRPIPGIPSAAPPSIRKLAQELGIDLTRVRGTEAGGRIAMADVRAYLQQLQEQAQPAAAPERAAGPAPVSVDFSQWGPIVKKPMTSIRRTISRRLHEAWTAIPHVTQFDAADITGLMELRQKYAAAYEAKGARLTLTAFALKAVVDVLKKHPIFNSSLDETTQDIVFKNYYHLGVAVDTEHGLMVPVIRHTDQKTLLDLARELEQAAEKTRQRKISADDMRGGTFTISNQGGIGSGAFTPVINRPEVAILGMGRGALQPVARGGQIEPRRLLPLGLSYDHRVIDGADAARFMVDLVQAFQEFPESFVRI